MKKLVRICFIITLCFSLTGCKIKQAKCDKALDAEYDSKFTQVFEVFKACTLGIYD